MNDVMILKWHELLRVWSVDPSLVDQMFEEVRQQYTELGRFYHTLDHVQNVIEIVESLGAFTQHLNAVKLAAWLHDLIYDSRASDNEERSAEYSEQLCRQLSIPDSHLVADLIRKTKTHDAGGNVDAMVLLDADLAILGASEAAYSTYAKQIRQEYAWVPESDYRQGRRRVLQSFLSRPKIYWFLCHREEIARQNLAREIAQLGIA